MVATGVVRMARITITIITIGTLSAGDEQWFPRAQQPEQLKSWIQITNPIQAAHLLTPALGSGDTRGKTARSSQITTRPPQPLNAIVNGSQPQRFDLDLFQRLLGQPGQQTC